MNTNSGYNPNKKYFNSEWLDKIDKRDQSLINRAFNALKNTYSPYSNFRVGACVETKTNEYFIGTNIENASLGLTNCAERNAIFSAYSHGYRKKDIRAIAIVSEDKKLTTPCGACRQVLSELLEPTCPIILTNGKELLVTDIIHLLPLSFSLDL